MPDFKVGFFKQAGQSRDPNSHGFTLIEILLAITIAGFVLGAAATMVVSVSDIWMDRQERNFFDDHVDGVAEFVQSCFTNAGIEIALTTSTQDSGFSRERKENAPPDPDEIKVEVDLVDDEEETTGINNNNNNNRPSESSALIRVSEEPVGWGRPPGFRESEDPLLNFKLRNQPPLLVNADNAPALGVDAFLYFKEREGLSLLWYSILQEEAEDEDDLRRTQISPYVKGISYIYWDEDFKQWEEEPEPMESDGDSFVLPRFIKLIFERDGEIKERTLTIPVPSQTTLLF